MKKITRRDFIKVTAASAAAVSTGGLLASCTDAEETPGIPETWDKEADVIVVGFGGAGAAAAIEAADAGAEVLLLEKQPENAHYCNSRMSGGIFHSPDPTGDREALKQYCKAMFSGEDLPWKLEGEQPDESDEVAESFAEYEPQNVEFMKSLDPQYDFTFFPPYGFGGASFPNFPGAEASKYMVGRGAYPNAATSSPDVPPYDKPKDEKSAGEAFFACLSTGVKARNNIEILYSAPLQRMVSRDGEIIGVIVDLAGEEKIYKAKKAVILTTGGYEYGVTMRRGFLEGPGVKGWAFYGSPDNTGEGISIAMLAGAGLAKVGKAASRIITAVPYGRGYNEHGLKMGLITPVVGRPNSIVVDCYGNRYAAENMVTDNPWRYGFYKVAVHFDTIKLEYPRVPSWLIFDETLRAAGPVTSLGISTAGYRFLPWTEDNQDAIDRGWILMADTIADLATKIKNFPDNKGKMSAETLTETVARFNAFSAQGEDTDYLRTPGTLGPVETPPFYSIPLYPGGPNTKGGIMADGKRRVLDWERNPIPRFYTAGEISSTFKFVYQGGGNLTECLVCGRIAGKNAAAETDWV
jgi:3-oxosteroid 1-dehydrogenase